MSSKLCSDCPFAALCLISSLPDRSINFDMLMRLAAARDPTLDNADKQFRYVAERARCVQRLKQIGEANYANVITSTNTVTVSNVQVQCPMPCKKSDPGGA
jgi:hypothetical protein